MYDHIGIRVTDLAASQRFYSAALGALGHALNSSGEDYAGYGAGPSTFWLHLSDRAPAKGAHICFAAPDQAAVQRFHAAGLAAGGRDNGAPGPRPEYSEKYYAAFLIDPDGNNVEAVVSPR
ncbi:MAG TPA: VOC family protein [Burkholderiaceae bacterium]